MDTAGLPEMDGAAADHPESLALGSDQERKPGRREACSFETVAAVVGQAEGLRAEGCIHTAAVVGHLVAEVGIHLEPGTAGTPDHPCQLGVLAALQDRDPVAGGARLVEGLQMRRRQCCQGFLSAPLVRPLAKLGTGPHSGQKQR